MRILFIASQRSLAWQFQSIFCKYTLTFKINSTQSISWVSFFLRITTLKIHFLIKKPNCCGDKLCLWIVFSISVFNFLLSVLIYFINTLISNRSLNLFISPSWKWMTHTQWQCIVNVMREKISFNNCFEAYFGAMFASKLSARLPCTS